MLDLHTRAMPPQLDQPTHAQGEATPLGGARGPANSVLLGQLGQLGQVVTAGGAGDELDACAEALGAGAFALG